MRDGNTFALRCLMIRMPSPGSVEEDRGSTRVGRQKYALALPNAHEAIGPWAAPCGCDGVIAPSSTGRLCPPGWGQLANWYVCCRLSVGDFGEVSTDADITAKGVNGGQKRPAVRGFGVLTLRIDYARIAGFAAGMPVALGLHTL